MNSIYRDRWIECSPEGIAIRGYYFPWGTKRIAYSKIVSVRRVEMSAFKGQMRGWGTSNPHYWASLDPNRRQKSVALILDVGRYVHPFITPDDPDTVETIVRERAKLGPNLEGTEDGPFV
jgi:hypothetical protein